MRKTILEQDIVYAPGRRLIKHLWKVEKSEQYPLGIEFSFQVLAFDEGTWSQIARMDNQLHGGRPGTHIHIGKKTLWRDVTLEDMEETILALAEKILERMK